METLLSVISAVFYEHKVDVSENKGYASSCGQNWCKVQKPVQAYVIFHSYILQNSDHFNAICSRREECRKKKEFFKYWLEVTWCSCDFLEVESKIRY